VAGALIYQEGLLAVIGQGSPVYRDLGLFNIEENETVAVTTSNSGTEGGKCRLNASVLSEIPLT